MSWNVVDTLLPIITSGIGAALTTQKNDNAASIASGAIVQGAQIGADAIREGSQQAQATLNSIRKEAAPATAYLRGVIADPGTLTPTQVTGLEEVRRGVGNQIHSSNFAGSGRTAAALFRRAESDYINNALESNRRASQSAANTMQGGATSAATGIANNQASTGAAIGKLYDNATTQAGLINANAETANGKVMGEAIGNIGSTIANEQRTSRYGDRMAKIEKALNLT